MKWIENNIPFVWMVSFILSYLREIVESVYKFETEFFITIKNLCFMLGLIRSVILLIFFCIAITLMSTGTELIILGLFIIMLIITDMIWKIMEIDET